MITRCSAIASLVLLATLAPLCAEDAGIGFRSEDLIGTVLARQAGQTVELRLVSGEKMGGKVEKVGANLVHLTQLTGAEFFEGAIRLDQIAAVVVRAKK
jgi:hypothetical protein